MSVTCTISEILSITSHNIKRSHDRYHVHLRDYLSIRRLILHLAKQCTKFEVSMFTHYEAMKGKAKRRNWVVWELAVKQCQRHIITILQSACYFLFDFNRNYVSILYRFRVITSYLSKVADFNLPTNDSRDPVFGRFDTIPACDGQTDERTDRQTGGRTHDDGQYRASRASRGKNNRPRR